MGLLQPYYDAPKRGQKPRLEKPKRHPWVPKTGTIMFLGLIGLIVLINLFYSKETTDIFRRSLCISGSLRRSLLRRQTRRLSCEVETVLADGTFDDAFGDAAPSPPTPSTPYAPTVDYTANVDDSATLPEGGADNIAFVVTLPACPEDTANASSTDPGDNFYDAAAVLKDSVCNCTSENPESGSSYSNTMYAVVHPDAINCNSAGTTGARRRLAQSATYDRVAVLEELGYYVLIYGEVLADSDKLENTRELMNLYAYNLTNHPVSVMVTFDTVFTTNIDNIVDELINDNTKKAKYSRDKSGKVNSGAVFVKPDTQEFESLVDIVKNTAYDQTNGWGGSGVVGNDLESLLTYHFDSDAASYEDETATMQDVHGVMSFGSNKDCGEPWECKVDGAWDAATQSECAELNSVWYRQRKSFEQRWSKTDLVDTSVSTYHTDMFLGYCQEGGKYVRASDYADPTSPPVPVEATPEPNTPEPNTPEPNTPVPNTPEPNTPVPNTPVPKTPEPNTPVPNTPEPNTPVPVSDLQQQWLDAHNTRREAFYNIFPSSYGVTNVPLKWSADIEQSAQNYADMLIAQSGCSIQHNLNGDSYGGENLAMNWASSGPERTPEQVLQAWYNDEIDLNALELVGQKFHASQVIFRSTKYLGCGHAQKSHNGGTCYIQVCRYIMAGNCFLEASVGDYPSLGNYFPPGCAADYPNKDWLCSTLGENTASVCSPNLQCPQEGCF